MRYGGDFGMNRDFGGWMGQGGAGRRTGWGMGQGMDRGYGGAGSHGDGMYTGGMGGHFRGREGDFETYSRRDFLTNQGDFSDDFGGGAGYGYNEMNWSRMYGGGMERGGPSGMGGGRQSMGGYNYGGYGSGMGGSYEYGSGMSRGRTGMGGGMGMNRGSEFGGYEGGPGRGRMSRGYDDVYSGMDSDSWSRRLRGGVSRYDRGW